MRALLALCMLTLVAAPKSTMALPPPLSPLQSCLNAADMDVEAARTCIGVSATACIETEDGGTTTIGMMTCHDRERAEWRALREASVDALRASESPTQVALLDAVLAEHERWSQARCAYGASIYEGGSMGRLLATACTRRLEAEFAIDLRTRLNEYGNR